ncbi:MULTISPECIES: Lrp/AsnC family transcriptional regulator [Acidiplasma]|jgi:Lrp/AsnC family transcriptional regulator for asnA, asnC and gidA|uniref:AsnC family transcriptional regulator n=2 Tax=Acidiplasma TaxID=507753 RepID=A0A0Q0XJP2_9ARCH|nr:MULTISPECIES: winged helix-turn-helix transcriptional regulator [Acidiplasma]KJE48844.1 AsnC family transcriptional regulator [Acidiplasma sp. MBA-1]KPV47032.1 AsnC family transcriptional regulator [Acidiplasma aeolicum]KQB34388.1 AsnC family transcriptional regulator [Acidiplasma aeolicum]KQB35171.1 AsnC family transcriptional regulator [Acidiplasma cupricumulans]WMT54240.1 MAG: winged helix-turn-helix transcriptional regulator [Acidiplasma sp.]
MDELDIKIVKAISENSKLSIRDLAKLCGVSPGTIHNRLMEMEKSKGIISYTARINYRKFNMEDAIIGFDITPETYIKTVEEIKKLNFVVQLYTTTGDHGAIAYIICNENETSQCVRALEKIQGVRNVYPSLIQNILK